MPSPDKMIVMGRVCAPFGVKGWIKVSPYTGEPERLLQFSAWWLGKEGSGQGWQPRTVAQARLHGDALIARLEGVADRDQASGLNGLEVALPRSVLPAPQAGEYYLSDLLGMTVLNRRGELLGTVAGFLETRASLVLKVRAEEERLIPFAESVVDEVELGERRIRVDWDASER